MTDEKDNEDVKTEASTIHRALNLLSKEALIEFGDLAFKAFREQIDRQASLAREIIEEMRNDKERRPALIRYAEKLVSANEDAVRAGNTIVEFFERELNATTK